MATYEVGDLVRCVTSCQSAVSGKDYTVGVENDSLCIGEASKQMCSCQEKWKLIKKKGEKTMNLTSMFKVLTDPSVQKLRKAGYINGDLELTQAGQSALNAVLFEANKEALVKLAEEKIAEEEKEK